ncbi:MAG: T9SS type A sorting domain-containing protein, partial [Balneolales bacterium]|nr:T9SS type A sorting domain-containing protein [Balneolales bacterium]
DETLCINGYTGSGNNFDQAVPNSSTIGEQTDTGYRLLTVLSTVEFSGIETANVDFDFPTGSEVSTMPFNFAVNDNDDQARDTQVSWSSRAGQDDWWNTPARWETVALVGLDAIVITSNEEEDDATPFTYSLEQNYPNPFNPSTNIEFTLANSSNVTLEIYNMLGQRVATLLDGDKMSAGAHKQLFDASSLASGMYLYKLTADNFTQTRKMMLIK